MNVLWPSPKPPTGPRTPTSPPLSTLAGILPELGDFAAARPPPARRPNPQRGTFAEHASL